MCACVRACLRACLRACVYVVCLCGMFMHVRGMCMLVVYVFKCVCIPECASVCVYVCTPIYVCAYVCVRV